MDTKNVIAAIALSSAVIVLYSLFFIPEKTEPKKSLIEKDKIEQKARYKRLKFEEFKDLKLEMVNRNFKKN